MKKTVEHPLCAIRIHTYDHAGDVSFNHRTHQKFFSVEVTNTSNQDATYTANYLTHDAGGVLTGNYQSRSIRCPPGSTVRIGTSMRKGTRYTLTSFQVDDGSALPLDLDLGWGEESTRYVWITWQSVVGWLIVGIGLIWIWNVIKSGGR